MKTQAALCAKAIREELKKSFPSIKFRVTSENFSMGNAVDIKYQDGVPEEMIMEIVGKYEYGYFDGMDDMYKVSNRREDIPQAKYVQVSRDISPEIIEAQKELIAKKFGITDVNNEDQWFEKFHYRNAAGSEVWKEIKKMSFIKKEEIAINDVKK